MESSILFLPRPYLYPSTVLEYRNMNSNFSVSLEAFAKELLFFMNGRAGTISELVKYRVLHIVNNINMIPITYFTYKRFQA